MIKRNTQDFPLRRTHCGFPLGNGMLGLLVWGGESRLCLTLNRSDFWDHRGGEMVPGESLFDELVHLYDAKNATSMDAPFEAVGQARPKGAFRNTRLPMGRFEFILQPGVTLHSGSLDLESGVLTILAQSNVKEYYLQIALHPTHPAIHVQDLCGIVTSIATRPAWEWVGSAMATRGFQPPEILMSSQESGWVQACPEDAAMAALCRRNDDSLFLVMVPGETAEDGKANARNLLCEMAQLGGAAFHDETVRWWNHYWQEIPQVTLPDSFFQDFLHFALFKFGAASSPQSALPSALQGPWSEEYQMPTWANDYHFNTNIQQIYTLAFAIGKTSHLGPLFDMLDRCHGVFRENARRMMGIDDGLLMTHTTDDRGYACGGVGPGACIDQAVSGWTAQLYWLYYQHTGDMEFLRNRAMPFMIGVMRVFEEMLEWDNSIPRLPISISAEYEQPLSDGSRQRVGRNASYQLACMHMLAHALTAGAQALGEPPQPAWIKIQEMLPPWTLVGGKGQERIAIWENTDLEVSHRHHSHLACIYPFDSLGVRSPEEHQIVKRSLERWLEVGMSDWSEWCLPWAAIIQAREGYTEGPHLLLKLFRDVFLNEGWASVYQPRIQGFTLHGIKLLDGLLETCEIMQLDGTMGFATAVYEMLAHSHGGEVRFFPAVPGSWKDVRFSDIRLPGCLKASGEKAHGEVQWIKLESPKGSEVSIDVPGYQSLTFERKGGTFRCPLPVHITLEEGECLKGVPSRANRKPVPLGAVNK